jgi:hypothetical protein
VLQGMLRPSHPLTGWVVRRPRRPALYALWPAPVYRRQA